MRKLLRCKLFHVCTYLVISISIFAQEGDKRGCQKWINKVVSFDVFICTDDTLNTILKDFIKTEKECVSLHYGPESLMFVIEIYERENRYILAISSSEFEEEILDKKPIAVTVIDSTACFISKTIPSSLFLKTSSEYTLRYRRLSETSKKNNIPVITYKMYEDSPYSILSYTFYKDGQIRLNSVERPCFDLFEDYNFPSLELEEID